MKKISKTPPNTISNSSQSEGNPLLVFNKKVKVFICVNILVLFLLTFLKIHGCSISLWNNIFGINEKTNTALVYGEPRGIRQDDWMVAVPFLLSQSNNGMSNINPSIGAGNPSLLMGLPFNDIIPVFRPAIAGFYLFDVERAYAFWWNFKIIGMTVSFFLLLLLLTKNNFYLSVFGSLWLFLSSGVQWWSFGIGLYVLSFSMIYISFIYILFSTNKFIILLNAIILAYFSYNFLDMLYPPWQVPLTYMLLIFLTAYLIENYKKELVLNNWIFKIACFSSILIVLIILCAHFYQLSKETIELMTNTAYPGKRVTQSANLDITKLFAEYFGIFMTDVKCPPRWLNICEASGFLMFFPIIIFSVVRNLIIKKQSDILLLLMSIFMLICLSWMLIPLPEIIGKITLFSTVPAYRLLVIFGFANIILTIVYLNRFSINETNIMKLKLTEQIISAIVIIILISLLLFNINKSVDNFFTKPNVLFLIIIFSSLFILLINNSLKYRNTVFCSIVILYLIPNIKIHPISKGLSPILKNPLVIAAREIEKQDPKQKWIVFGQSLVANLLISEGINVFNGVKFLPNLPALKILDPENKYNTVYNRFAHIVVTPYITGTDSIIFKLNENNVVNDNYSLFVDPCSKKLNKIGIKFVLFTYQPQPSEIRCMTLVSTSILPIYKVNDF